MGYFSELSIRLKEQKEALLADGSWEDCSYPSQLQQLLWRLEDYKDILQRLIEERRRWETACYGAPRSNWEQQYRQWPNYWPPQNPEAFYVLPSNLSPEDTFSLEDVMEAIAGTQNRLLSYGYDADAEEERQSRLAGIIPLEGQLALPLAA